MFNVDKEDILTRATRYELLRQTDRIFIDVHEVLHGETDYTYVAMPTNIVNVWADQRYWGTGKNEKEALDNCLGNIKDVAVETIFPDIVMPAEDQGPLEA
ncbi:MAG: hypothetical protein ACLFOY_01205 [Desulfatibacillaceae bacterium]